MVNGKWEDGVIYHLTFDIFRLPFCLAIHGSPFAISPLTVSRPIHHSPFTIDHS